MEQTRIAKVHLLSTPKWADREFDYLCPGSLPVFRGAVVKIPFGKANRERFGVVTQVIETTPEMELKAILQVLPPEICLTEELLQLCQHLKEQLFCSFGDATRAILPSPVYQKKARAIRILCAVDGVYPKTALQSFRGKNKEKYQALLEYLSLVGSAPEKTCRELFDLDHAGISILQKKSLVCVSEKEFQRDPFAGISISGPEENKLSEAQQNAFEILKEKLDGKTASAALLHGVTGSGKTRVMLALCDHVLKMGKTVLFLVPEIALTAQSAKLLFGQYGDRVAMIHSALSEGERRDTYAAIRSGKKSIVLGTRSAVFAPLSNLGLVVIDEEQDGSYKSDTGLKYHARDVARFRCAKNHAMLLLASATPDIESYYKAKSGIYTLVSLTQRYGEATLPDVRIIDLRSDLRNRPGELIGSVLEEEIRRNLEQGEQTILLMNRRGYRRFVSCLSCGSPIRCPHCSVSMTLHNGPQKRLSCHYCGYATTLPQTCPECHSEHLVPHGFGIQQLEEELKNKFPEARTLRLDSDSLSGKHSHETILEQFRNGEADILIGTQMVAKGHNFPNVTLVGIVMADSALYLSDFRAAEHTFSLLTQVIGRAGRAKKRGRALIQTLNPRHNVFSLAAAQDYPDFYEGEIALRKAFQFPPFCNLALFTLSHESEAKLDRCAEQMGKLFADALKGPFSDVKIIIYGPFPSPIYKIKNIYRKRFIIKYKNNTRTRALFDEVLTQIAVTQENGAAVTLDIGPGLI